MVKATAFPPPPCLHSLLFHSTLYLTIRTIFPELEFDHIPPLLIILQPNLQRISPTFLNILYLSYKVIHHCSGLTNNLALSFLVAKAKREIKTVGEEESVRVGVVMESFLEEVGVKLRRESI